MYVWRMYTYVCTVYTLQYQKYFNSIITVIIYIVLYTRLSVLFVYSIVYIYLPFPLLWFDCFSASINGVIRNNEFDSPRYVSSI